jgi:hypothetical protein
MPSLRPVGGTERNRTNNIKKKTNKVLIYAKILASVCLSVCNAVCLEVCSELLI